MQGRISGFFMTAVMALPLAAIPLMSIFGIPQFGSLASTVDADTGFLLEDPTSAADWDSAPAFSLAQSSAQVEVSQNPMVVPVSNNLSSRNGLSEPGRVFSSESENSLTWEQAIEQLARYGIHDYRLQPGLEINTFHFACYRYGNSGRQSATTVVRFEAESATPLQAVRITLQQIKQWYR